jgi:hypothetical protein
MEYPQGLGDMFGPYVGGDMMSAQFGQALTNDRTANQKSLQDMMFAQQEQPLKLEGLRSTNRNTNATADKTELGNQFTRDTWDPRVKAEVAKFASEVDDAQLKQINSRLERDMMSPDPQVRAQAQKTYQFTKEMTKFKEEEKMKHGNKMSEIGETGRQQRLTQQQAIDAGKWAPKGGGTGSDGDIEAIVAKMGFEKSAQFFFTKSQLALRSGKLEEAQFWGNLADEMKKSLERGKMLSGQQNQAGKIATGEVAQMPTHPAPQPQGFGGSPQQAQGQVGPSTPNPNAQQQGNFVTGQSYKGKTGTYKYLGGDPKNKANWQKVE